MLGGPEEIGRRLLPHVVAYQAQENPNESFLTFPLDPNDHTGPWRQFTFSELARAQDYASWWIDKHLPQGKSGDVVSYLGATDVRYLIFILAGIKTGRTVFLPSTRNTLFTNSHLLKTLNVTDIVYTPERSASVQEMEAAHPDLRLWEIPSLDEMIREPVDVYPYNATYEEEEDTKVAIMHSSGTTGMPKPVYFTNGFFACFDNRHACKPTKDGRHVLCSSKPGQLHLVPAVFFHLMGFQSVLEAVFHNQEMLMVSDSMMNVGALVDVIKTKRPTSATLVSFLVQELYLSGNIEVLRPLDYVVTGGGPMKKEIGEEIGKVARLVSGYGSTEAGISPFVMSSDPKGWNHVEILPEWGLQLEHFQDNLYEGVFTRGGSRKFQGIFHSHPHLQEYRTKDLFSKHPTDPGVIVWQGRIDDVICLANGEKFNPTTMEFHIQMHPKVKKTFVIGDGQFEPALLLELEEVRDYSEEEQKKLINEIWPTVIEANKMSLTHGRILKNRIGIANQRFVLTPKGTIHRRETRTVLAATIEEIYSRPLYTFSGSTLPNNPTLSEVENYVLHAVANIIMATDLTLDSNIVDYGVDSLHIFQLTSFIRETVLVHSGNDVLIPTTWIYSSPTVKRVVEIVHSLLMGKGFSTLDSSASADNSIRIEKLVKKYTENLPTKRALGFSAPQQHNVILTGSTGALGTYILTRLLSNPTISTVYCLNRSVDGEAKQSSMFKVQGLDFAMTRGKVFYHQAKYGERNMGLTSKVYEEMLSCVDLVIHNAWEVNFNHSLESFEPTHIRGVRRWIDFSLESKFSAHIHFISSRGSTAGWNPLNGPVPEEIIEDGNVADIAGYGASKHVSERILSAAATQSGVPSTIYRVGQVSGPTTEQGEWNRKEWFYSLISTSKEMGKVPSSLPGMPMDWISVDTMASIVLELVLARSKDQQHNRCQVFHLSNPKLVEWSSLVHVAQQHINAKPVDCSEWVQALDGVVMSEENLKKMPALKLKEFWKAAFTSRARPVAMATEATAAASATMRNLVPTNESLLKLYLQQWRL